MTTKINFLFLPTLFLLAACSHLPKPENQPVTYSKTANVEPERKPAVARSSASDELVLKGSYLSLSSGDCMGPYGSILQDLFLIQSRQVFFRIYPDNGGVTPEVVMATTSSQRVAKTHPIEFSGEGCDRIKRCVDKMASSELSVASRCENGIFKADFYKAQ